MRNLSGLWPGFLVPASKALEISRVQGLSTTQHSLDGTGVHADDRTQSFGPEAQVSFLAGAYCGAGRMTCSHSTGRGYKISAHRTWAELTLFVLSFDWSLYAQCKKKLLLQTTFS